MTGSDTKWLGSDEKDVKALVRKIIDEYAAKGLAWPSGADFRDLRRARRDGDFAAGDIVGKYKESPYFKNNGSADYGAARIRCDFDENELLDQLRLENGEHKQDIVFHKVRFTSDLLLRSENFRRSFRFFECVFDGRVFLDHAELRAWEMTACDIGLLSVRHTAISQSLILDFSRTDESIDLTGAKVGKDFSFRFGKCKASGLNNGDSLSNRPRRYAVIARRCTIGGDVRIDGSSKYIRGDQKLPFNDNDALTCADEKEVQWNDPKFIAVGGVTFESSTISGNLVCRNGYFHSTYDENRQDDNSKDDDDIDIALNISNLTVGRNVLLDGDHYPNYPQRWKREFISRGAVRIHSSKFQSDVSIENASVRGHLSLRGTSISKKLELKNLLIEGQGRDCAKHYNDLEKERKKEGKKGLNETEKERRRQLLKIDGALDLTGVDTIVLEHDKSAWPKNGKLIIEDFTYEVLSPHKKDTARRAKQWLGKQSSELYNPHFHENPWRRASKVLKDMGDTKGAHDIIVEMETAKLFRLSSKWWDWTRTQQSFQREDWNFLQILRSFVLDFISLIFATILFPLKLLKFLIVAFYGLSVGFGYRPHRGVMWSITVILIGWGVYEATYWKGGFRPQKEDVVMLASRVYVNDKRTPVRYEPFNSLIYSLDVFFPLSNFHQDQYWQVAGDRPDSRSLARLEVGHESCSGIVMQPQRVIEENPENPEKPIVRDFDVPDPQADNSFFCRAGGWLTAAASRIAPLIAALPYVSSLPSIAGLFDQWADSPFAVRAWLWIQIGLGWLLTTLTGLSFSGILRRDP